MSMLENISCSMQIATDKLKITCKIYTLSAHVDSTHNDTKHGPVCVSFCLANTATIINSTAVSFQDDIALLGKTQALHPVS